MESLRKKSPFIKVFSTLTKACVFSVNGKLLKQVHNCSMSGPISIVFSNIYIYIYISVKWNLMLQFLPILYFVNTM